MTDQLTGTCPSCLQIFNLRPDGTVRLHNRDNGNTCGGSGLAPAGPAVQQWGWIRGG